jgi:phosphopantetheine--protein transferase-like protein
MILGVGIDISDPARFSSWSSYRAEQMRKIFSHDELIECFGSELAIKQTFEQTPERACEFLSSRFAAKEAFYKALSNALISLGTTHVSFSFARARAHIEVRKGVWDVPQLQVDWQALEEMIGASLPAMKAHLSFSHEKTMSAAIVIISKII